MNKTEKATRLNIIKKAHKKILKAEKAHANAAKAEARRLMVIEQSYESTQVDRDLNSFSEENLCYHDVDRYVRESTDIYDNYLATDTSFDSIR
jgi:hypothetical protein